MEERVQQIEAVGFGDVHDPRARALRESGDGHGHASRCAGFADIVPRLASRGAAVVLADGAAGGADAG